MNRISERTRRSANVVATFVTGIYGAAAGVFIAVGFQLLLTSVCESVARPWFIQPGVPLSIRSYGQQFGFVMMPMGAMLGAGLGFSAGVAAHGRRLVAAVLATGSASVIAWKVSQLWIDSHTRYGFDLSDWALYAPLLIEAGLVIIVIILRLLVQPASRFGQERQPVNEILKEARSALCAFVRIVLLAISFFGGMYCFGVGPMTTRFTLMQYPQLVNLEFVFGILFLVSSLLTTPFLVTGIVWLAWINTASEHWNSPTVFTNPFRLENPLWLFHLAASVFAVAGLGGIWSATFDPNRPISSGGWALLFAVALFLGIWFVKRMFKQQLPRPTTVPQH